MKTSRQKISPEAARKAAGLTAEQAAAKAGVTSKTVFNFEAGKNIGLRVFASLVRVYKVDAGDLMRGWRDEA